ncbi:MAG: extracellular solute-binding protein [Kofleriaceae bacterium]|nr:extracellular solute-binding protein [Kofleriaceae bacterium]
MRASIVAILCFFTLLFPIRAEAEKTTVTLWHSYRDAEQKALEQVVETFNAAHQDVRIQALAQSYESYASKLTTAIPRDNGPDLFIYAHERIGGWAEAGLISALDADLDEGELDAFFPETIEPLRYQDKLYALPLAFKSLVLYYNKALVQTPPTTTDELVAMADKLAADKIYALAYQHENFYFHAPWHFGFGAVLFTEDGQLAIDSEASLQALAFVKDLQASGYIPQEPTGAVITQLFNEGDAAMVINGPWFLGEISPELDFGIASIPIVSATGLPASPFLTDEAVFISAETRKRDASLLVARYLVGAKSAAIRASVGRQAVANRAAWSSSELADDDALKAFRDILPKTTAMESGLRMRSVWEPTQLMLRKLLRRDSSPAEAANAGLRRFRAVNRPPPVPANPTFYIAASLLMFVLIIVLAVRSLRSVDKSQRRKAARGWRWIGPAMTGTMLLLFIPFVVGLVLSLFAHRNGDWTFVGMANFIEILSAQTYGPTEPLSFYFAFAVTILWTGVNLVLHLGIGLGLALLVAKPALKMRALYRVLLIIPWAVPNYITALVWKGMFHRQYGAINGFLEWCGVDGVSWFSSFWTAFFANVCANAWLGFPFMMIVCLGALQSVPTDLYEAADVDGASGWQKFRHITLPMIRPALVPAVLIGTVWTFNQFNIVYLVSGGEPDNSTDILISEAYRWAFTRQEQYGYAAAYAALIFLILLGWSLFASRMNKRAEDS